MRILMYNLNILCVTLLTVFFIVGVNVKLRAQSKNIPPRKPKLSMIKCGQQMDRWLLGDRLYEILQSQILFWLYKKSFAQDCKPRSPICIRKRKDHIHKLKIL